MSSITSAGSSSSVIYPRKKGKKKKDKRPLIVPSTFGYASGYTKAKSIPEQIDILYKLFPFLYHRLFTIPISTRAVPNGAEGYFVIPPWQLFAQTYHEAIIILIGRLGRALGRSVYLYCHGKIKCKNLSRDINTENALKYIGGGADDWWKTMIIIPAQLGIYYRGASPLWVKRSLRAHEFSLGLFEGMIMLATHHERLNCDDDLGIEFPGDSFFPKPEKKDIHHTPFINIVNGKIGIGTSPTDKPGECFGSATGFLL